MKVLFLNCNLLYNLFNFLSNTFKKLLCFVKKRKLSSSSPQQKCLPTSIQIHSDKATTEVELADWNNWGEEEKKEENVDDIPAEALFKDMEPVINKAKVVLVKKKVKGPPLVDPFAFKPSNSLTPQYQVEGELGTWEDDDESGWGEELDDNEITQQTQSMLKQNKQLERERRAQQQQRKKLEREQNRHLHNNAHIGVKIS